MSQCEWTHCCFGLIRRDKRGVNRFPSLGRLKSPLESMGHTPVRLSVYQPVGLLSLQQDTGYGYSHGTLKQGNSIAAALTPRVMPLTPRSGGKGEDEERGGGRKCGDFGGKMHGRVHVCVSSSVRLSGRQRATADNKSGQPVWLINCRD